MIEVSLAAPDDIVYIDSLQRKNAEDLSFYPKIALEREILNRRILLARIDGDPCGYLYHGALISHSAPIHQACIQYDLRGMLYGALLVNTLITECKTSKVPRSISLRCGSDIAANGFWSAMGFQCVAVTKGGARRMRDINHWRLELQSGLFDLEPIDPSTKEKSAKAWAKARRDGISASSQFIRGDQMQQYRKKIEEQET